MRRALAALVALLLLAGCTSGKGRSTTSTAPSASTPASTATTSSAASSSRPASSSAASHSSSTGPALAPCQVGALRLTVLRGVGAGQQQFATLTLANASRSACLLPGYAAAQLLRAGRPLGVAVSAAGAARPGARFAAGARARAQLTGPSSCNAPLSDTVRVTLASSTGHVDGPLLLRACPLRISAFTIG